MDPANIRVAETAAALATELGRYIAGICDDAIAARGVFTVASSGGSLPKVLVDALKAAVQRGEDLRTEQWHVFYADERCVPLDDPDSNHAAHAALFAQPWWKAPAASVHAIDATLAPPACAAAYEATIRAVVGGVAAGSGAGAGASFAASSVPSFDLVLLGMGPDGHTASLFPGHPLLGEGTLLVAPITDSPKPPPCRVTFTLPLLAGARAIAVITTGEAKAERLLAALDPGTAADALPPVAHVKAAGGLGPTWFIDSAAASQLPPWLPFNPV